MNSNIRNFCIVAHIDHGKSTLADRLLEATGTIDRRQMREQVLDSNPIERERGITIKLAPVRMLYKLDSPKSTLSFHSQVEIQNSNIKMQNENEKIFNFDFYILNLIDTPGHVDFNYEVSRSLQACEGAILIVDATQGVQAQTLANLNLARKQNLVIIPVVNKIDLPNAQIERSIEELGSLGFRKDGIITISAKLGTNVDQVLNAIIERIPPPKGDKETALRALVFSSQYDIHKGVVVFVRIVDGEITTGPVARFPPKSSTREPLFGYPSTPVKQANSFVRSPAHVTRLQFFASGVEFEPLEVGYFNPEMKASGSLLNGEVGYIATGLKEVGLAKVGDTVTLGKESRVPQVGQLQQAKGITGITSTTSTTGRQEINTCGTRGTLDTRGTLIIPLPGYHEPKPMVFLGLYPINSDEYPQVRDAMGKLRLSDSAFTFRPISSQALGHGFHCGFLGLLHAEVVQERLSREFNLDLLATAPTVEYKVKLKTGKNVISIIQLTERDPKGFRKIEGDSSPAKPDRNDNYLTIQSAFEYPDPSLVEQTLEPVMQVTIFAPKDYTGAIMQLCQDKRGDYIELGYLGDQGKYTYLMPLSEMIVDFFDRLKSITAGYASLDYEFFDYQPVKLVKLDILLNHEKVDAFSQLVVEEKAVNFGKLMVDKLKDVIPRHQFAIPIQAAIGGKILARSDVKPFRKDVTKKLYGGDRTRKDKLLEAQRKGKKRMKRVGRVEIPQEAFLKVFKAE